MEGVLLAAGYASRMGGLFKCALVLLSAHLFHYPAHAMKACGVRRIVLVCGPHNKEACSKVAELVEGLGVEATTVVNERPDWGNGVSLLRGVEEVSDKFLASVCDHVYPEELPLTTLSQLDDFLIVVAADKRPKLVNLEEATKILAEGRRIVRVSKALKEFTHVDAGVFAGRRELVEAIRPREGLTISALLEELGKEGLAGVAEFEGLPWFDLDDPSEVKESLRGPRLGHLEWLRKRLGARPRTDPFLATSIGRFQRG